MKVEIIKTKLNLLFLLLFAFSLNTGFSQSNVWCYLNGNVAYGACYNLPVNGFIYFGGGGLYVAGDTIDISIDWNDGTIDSFPNNIFLIASDSIVPIPIQHTWTAPGTYNITVTAVDHYSNTYTYNQNAVIMADCGYLAIGAHMDSNGNGVYDSGSCCIDFPLPGAPINLSTSITNYATIEQTYGFASISSIDQNATTYHLEIDPAWLTANGLVVIDPPTGSYDFTSPPIPPNQSYYHFLLNCPGSLGDASISTMATGFKPGLSSGRVDFSFLNFLCAGTPVNIDLTVSFDPILTPSSSSFSSYNVVGNTLTSTINVSNGFNYGHIYFSVPPGTLPGTPLTFNSSINVTSYTDNYLSNNQSTVNSYVLNAWDPNDKATDLAEMIDPQTTEEINYTIRFQNMGNDFANQVTIIDTIDTQLDLSTFRLVAQKYDGSYEIDSTSRVIKFTFPNIMLPYQSISDEGSKGFVTYKITENSGLPVGSVLNNKAYIYFDTNPAVITNTTSNINTNLGIENNTNSSVIVYPQPANDRVYISGIDLNEIDELFITDNNGRVIQLMNGTKAGDGISVSNLAAGMYFVTMRTKENTLQQKLIVYH